MLNLTFHLGHIQKNLEKITISINEDVEYHRTKFSCHSKIRKLVDHGCWPKAWIRITSSNLQIGV